MWSPKSSWPTCWARAAIPPAGRRWVGRGVRFATTTDREAVLTRVVDAAETASVQLTPPDLATVLAELLGADQAAAVITVVESGRVVDVLVGPAGAGKTTAMRTLRHAWEDLYGTGSVIGLAPSAAAAEVLGAYLEIATETCAKWLHDNLPVRAGQLVIIDEASLAGTTTLDRITAAVAEAGGKALLVGDPAQLAAVDAGGALTLLANDRDDVAELTNVRRFHHDWEAIATLQLRRGAAPDAVEPDLIVGLIPAATGPMGRDMHAALQQRQQLIHRCPGAAWPPAYRRPAGGCVYCWRRDPTRAHHGPTM